MIVHNVSASPTVAGGDAYSARMAPWGHELRRETRVARLSAVFFDVGETLVDETREYGTWADWLGVPRHTFSAVFGAVIARGGDYRETFQHFRPGFDLWAERERRAEVGQPETFGEPDLYPDVRDCLTAIRAQGILVGVAGNQTLRAGAILQSLDLPADVLGTSQEWGVEKPDPAFFERITAEAGVPAQEILYVGDRQDVDVLPAIKVGLQVALVRRGPWGRVLEDPDITAQCLFTMPDLTTLPQLVRDHNLRESDR
jgi:FMN phosphatase YigB (HAD superfamily)